MLRVLIVDDERRARERLTRMLAAYPDLSIVGEAENGLEALEAIDRLHPDAIFLDVQMPGLDGFEMLRELPAGSARPAIVFTTAFDQYAVQAFEVSAVDYLMKPIEDERLRKAVERLRSAGGDDAVDRLMQHVAPAVGPYWKRITAKRLQRYHVLAVDTIECFTVEDELVFAITASGRFLVNATLRELETRLDPERFARVHKQTIANLEKIAELDPIAKGGVTARMESGATIEISRRFAPALRDKLGW